MRKLQTLPLVLATTLAITLSGCSAQEPSDRPVETPRGTENDALAFTKTLFADVLTGDVTACERFTDEGRDDFINDMNPAASCEEAVDILGEAVGENYDYYTEGHVYTVESSTDTTVLIRADFVTYADLMTVEWVNGTWMAGSTERVDSNQPPATGPGPDTSTGDGHIHDH